MALSNFGELKAAVAARAIRSDLTSLIPDFIRSAHDAIVNTLCVCATMTLDAENESLPDDFRELITVRVDALPSYPLVMASEAQMANLGSGRPEYFRVDGSTLHLGPQPDRAYPAKLLYKLARTFFSADADTNTALIRYPFIYLNGAMAELFAHTRNAEERDRYMDLMVQGIEVAKRAEQDDFWSGAVLQPSIQGGV